MDEEVMMGAVLMNSEKWGKNIIMGKNVSIGDDVYIGHNCIIEDDVAIGNHTYIDNNTTIRSNTAIGPNGNIGCNCVIGEYWMDFYQDHERHNHPLTIGADALIRSGSIIYAGSTIGNNFQTGHQVTIREQTHIGNHVSIGTLSDVQGNCKLGNYVRLHSNVFVAPLSEIDDFVWIFPHAVLTNDPTPPSDAFSGVHIHPFAVIAARAVILPGMDIGQDSLIGAGSVVTKSVKPYALVCGNPAKVVSDVRDIKKKMTGEPAYPWRYHFSKYMPWTENGFDEWYSLLDAEEKKAIQLVEEDTSTQR